VELSIIGAGRTGRTLGRLALRAGYSIGAVVCRTASHAREAASFIGAGRPGTELRGSELTIVAVPDAAIPSVARSIRMPRGGVMAHTCASLGAEALRPWRPAGAIHPLRSFGDPAKAADAFAGTACAIDGDPAAVKALEKLARAIGGEPLRVKTGRKALYHAGAVFASNYVISTLEAALRLFERAGVPRRKATPVLVRLAEGTLQNVTSVGIPEALTGPIERGDVETVRRHARAIFEVTGTWGPNFQLGLLAIDAAVAKGSIRERDRIGLVAALASLPSDDRRKKAAVRR
jgi:predicted short-subunit dehydrogenase-like oxidoreductase (DUF2520 family)